MNEFRSVFPIIPQEYDWQCIYVGELDLGTVVSDARSKLISRASGQQRAALLCRAVRPSSDTGRRFTQRILQGNNISCARSVRKEAAHVKTLRQ